MSKPTVDTFVNGTTNVPQVGVKSKGDEVVLYQQSPTSISPEYWDHVTVRSDELSKLLSAFRSGNLPDSLRGGSWQTDASLREEDTYVKLVQSSAGAGGRNGDCVRLDEFTLDRVIDAL